VATGPWPPVGAWPAEVAALVGEAAGSAAQASGLLRAAAVLAVVQLAAELGRPFAGALPSAAGAETLPAAPTHSLQSWLLLHGPARLQHEMLALLAARGLRLPDAVLPAALDLGRRSVAMRPVVAPVLGSRGAWLAAQRDDWRWAAGREQTDDEAHWNEGSLVQRAEVLRHQRAHAPDAARQRLATALPGLPANERAELLATLAVGLAGTDEALLESMLSDRSREVRQAAAALLLRLPGSAFVARAMARMAPLLRQEHVPPAGTRWCIEPPAELAAPDPPRPQHDSLGERAWWLYQAARQVPLAWWTQHTGLDAAALLAWASDGDWAEALHRAWREQVFTGAEPAWCSAFLRAWPRGAGPDDRAAVLALLPLPEREAHWQRVMDAEGLSDAVLLQLDPGCPPPQHLSASMSQALLAALSQRLASRSLRLDGLLRDALPDLVGLVHPHALATLGPQLAAALRDDETPATVEWLHTVQRLASARATLHPRTPPWTT
jgi:hypothetical protein